MPSKHTFNPATLEKMRLQRHISHGIIAKNSGFEVQGFLMGAPLVPQQPHTAATPSARSHRVSVTSEPQSPFAAAAIPRVKLPQSDAQSSEASAAVLPINAADARDDFTDMFVSMVRRYSKHPNAPDVFATLLLSQENPEDKNSPCVKSLIEGLGAASHACLIWSFLYLNPQVSHNIMKPIQDLRMNSKASLYSSVIAFSDSDLQQSGHFTLESQAKKEALHAAMNECKNKGGSGGSIIMPKNVLDHKRILSGIDEVFFVENADAGERFDNQHRLKQHVALRLQAETYISDVYQTSGVYAVCGGDLKQFMSDLQWCCSQRCHLLIFADSGGLCSGLVHAISLHKTVLLVADKILKLCQTIAGGGTPASRSSRVCNIENTISMCLRVLDRVEAKDLQRAPNAYSELQRITQLLAPEDNEHDYLEGLYPGRVYEPQDRLMRRKSITILNARRAFASNQVHPDSPRAAKAKIEQRSFEQHLVLAQSASLLREHAAQMKLEGKENPYVLMPSQDAGHSATRPRLRRRNTSNVTDFSEGDYFIVMVRRALANLSKLQWHTAVVKELQAMEPLLSRISFEDSVLAIVNLVEKCSVSVVFTGAGPESGSPKIDCSKLVAQCIMRRAIEAPSVAMGHPAVDMFGETSLMVAVASGSKQRVELVLNSPGIDVHYICRCSSHPAAFGMNALLVAVMLQLPDIAEAIVNKLLELLANPLATVFLRDDVDQQRLSEAAGIGKIKHSVKTVKMVDYIQNYNTAMVQDCLSSRHPEYHITALMFACRWGYAHLLPKFFELVKMQESIKTFLNPDEDEAALLIITPLMRYKKIAQSLPVNAVMVQGDGGDGGELAEARSQSEFKKLLQGDHNSDFGIDVNGRSALHHAVSSGSAACVSFCMDLGADALRKNKKYTYCKGGPSVGSSAAAASHATEFQDEFEPQTRIYCGFSAQELRHLHEMGEFEAYKINVNPELGSAIHCCMFAHSFDTFLPRLREMVRRDSVSSVSLQTKQEHAQPDLHLWLTVCNTAFDAALFSWGIHGIYFDRKKLELEFELREQSFTKDVLVQQQALVRLKTHRNLMQGCVEALEGSQTSKLESISSSDAGEVAFSSRGSILVREFIRNKAYRRIILPLLSSFAMIALLFIFCSLINAGISPRETRSFAQTYLRGIRDTYMDIAGGSGTMRVRTLDDMPQFMTGIEPFLSAMSDDQPVQRLGSVRMSFMFEQRKACTGLTAGMCASHYEYMMGYTSSTLGLASTEADIQEAATAQFMNFSSSVGAKFRSVSDCGYVYCFNALAVQLLLPVSSAFKPTWTSLKALLPQLSSLRFIQLGFILHSPAIEQSIGVRLLFEVQEIADMSVHDRFTSIRIAPDVSFWRLSSQPRGILSVLLFIFCSVRLLLLLIHFAHDRSESVAPQDGLRATYRRCLPVLFSSWSHRNAHLQFSMSQVQLPVIISAQSADSVPQRADDDADMTKLQALTRLAVAHVKLLGAFAQFLVSHQGISALFCTLSFALLILNISIQDDMKAIFDIGDAPKDAALFANADFVSRLLDGKMQSLEFRLSSLRDLMAFALLIVFATLLKHLERLPVLGPKLCAITAVLCDSVVIVFVAFIFLVSAAYAMAAFVGYSLDTSDRNDVVQSKLETFFMRAFNQILNIDTQTDFAFTRHGFSPDNLIGSAGLYYVVTAVIGNLILSNLIVTVIGERYTLALEANRSSHWGIELNRHLARKRVMLKLQDDCIAKLRMKRPFWRQRHFWGARRVMLVWATLFEGGWKPYGLRLYPWEDEKGQEKGELQMLYESVEIQRLQGESVDTQ